MECALYGNQYAVVFLYYTLEIEFSEIIAEFYTLYGGHHIWRMCDLLLC